MRTWQLGSSTDEEDLYEDDVDSGNDINSLLQAIADLDTAFEGGEIEEDAYTTQREKLKSELKLLWE